MEVLFLGATLFLAVDFFATVFAFKVGRFETVVRWLIPRAVFFAAAFLAGVGRALARCFADRAAVLAFFEVAAGFDRRVALDAAIVVRVARAGRVAVVALRFFAVDAFRVAIAFGRDVVRVVGHICLRGSASVTAIITLFAPTLQTIFL